MVDAPACSLDRRSLAERRARWERLVVRAGDGGSATSSGARLAFRALPGVEAELHGLASLERECCAFADFVVRTEDERVVLDVTAASPEGADAVRALLRSS